MAVNWRSTKIWWLKLFHKDMGLYPHIALFSSNLFHGQITQRYIDQLSDPKNKKCSPWIVFGMLTTLKTSRHFWAGEAGNFFCQARKLFSAEIWKMTECHFWADVIMLRQPRVSRGSLVLKWQGLRATFFVF